ncbi:hypothetical protein A2215_04530 [Candidatus Berkelbacteria bacterium RIFOXYA2_FULL_43_10]|uniref:Uncharacterized protein n=1 Tax=Candidatus Berkelbacteria bacterium RIFOXYA2_FULL_43_10 TaxID=1797472 RepID=A0A1F5E3J3_9BACT|nr:MAG: hypothetical protein A2215_04530 [Candidatus Berkelbacteria bacterium RIFOXYA2_FULL_43_10]
MIEAAIRAGFRFDRTDFTDGYDVQDIHLGELHTAACESSNASVSTAVRKALGRPAFHLGGTGIANEIYLGCQFNWDGRSFTCTSFRHNEKLGHYVVATPGWERRPGDPRIYRFTHAQFAEAEKERKATGKSRGRIRH